MNQFETKLKDELLKLYLDYLKNDYPKQKKFNYSYLRAKHPSLVSSFESKKLKIVDAFNIAGISYDHHRSKLEWGKTDSEEKGTFKILLSEIINGANNDLSVLSDSAMNTSESIPLPSNFFLSADHSLADKFDIKLFGITKRSIYAKGRTLFGSWRDAISILNIDYDADVLRKIASRSLIDTIEMLDEFDKKKGGVWSFQDVRNESKVLDKALTNAFKKREVVPFAEFSNQKTLIMLANLAYWREHRELNNDTEWWEKNSAEIIENYYKNHRAQESWSMNKIQQQVLERFAAGENLSRPELDGDSEGKKLLAALRSNKWGSGKGEVSTLKRVGVLTPELQSLQQIINDIPLDSIMAQLRSLVKDSLETGENKLSREHMENHYYELFTAASRWRNRLTKPGTHSIDWASTLKFFGLNPDIFSISASKRTKRAFAFQRYIKDILNKYLEEKDSVEEVLFPNQFCSDKLFPKEMCNHFERCRPDFYFGDTIIDTKTGGTLAKREQLERYLDHADRVILVTINDKSKTKKFKNGSVEIIKVATFIQRSKEILGLQIPNEELDGLSNVLRDSTNLVIENTKK